MRWISGCAAVLAICGSAYAAIPTDGLVLYYPFAGHTLDLSPSRNDAQAQGGALTLDRFGRSNAAYHLSGFGEYLQSAQPLPESESVTVSLWFTLDSWTQVQNWTAPQVLFFEGDDNGGHDLGLLVVTGFHFVTKSDERVSAGNWLPEAGKWTHLVCVADAAASQMAIWINGRKMNQGFFSGGANRGFHAPFNLGRRPGGFNDWHFNGSVDEVRVYNRALSDIEVGQIYSAESGTARNLKISVETVRLTVGLEPGRRYILQSSADLMTWTDYGAAFTATAAQQDFSVTADEQRKYWRVVVAPN